MSQRKTAEESLSEHFPSCTCGEVYTIRKLTAPDCVRCNYFDDAVDGAKAFAKQEVEARDEKIKILTEGMENILNPINYLQQEAEKQGSQLDGIGATNLIKDPSFYQNLARLALTKAQSFNQE